MPSIFYIFYMMMCFKDIKDKYLVKLWFIMGGDFIITSKR